MAAPPSVTIKTLDGKWAISKPLSDSPDPVLALQGMGWLMRKAIGLATVTQHLKSWTGPPDDDPTGPPITHIQIEQTATGGIKGTTESRNLDWKPRPHSDHVFGEMMGKSRWSSTSRVLEENVGTGKKGYEEDDARFLCEGWLEESAQGEVVESWVNNEKAGWTGWQVWGFAEVDGQEGRWLVRRFVVRKGERVERIRLVYEWLV
ncbi:hypothetical protein K504DRAFT_440126 [Pleomassaria siparia CBS 279.74]|uniref:Uncharacterized protein n=1 Tax=Pleomassaria siparia CBS 279.74 TaxID=1314801 RepID=A0A6G1JX88_9PLEO|nr:hypothetical protein K504DRAFT_440126 [Pleomassaria siparia CBS 279.74]